MSQTLANPQRYVPPIEFITATEPVQATARNDAKAAQERRDKYAAQPWPRVPSGLAVIVRDYLRRVFLADLTS